jgi:hypothetical protein
MVFQSLPKAILVDRSPVFDQHLFVVVLLENNKQKAHQESCVFSYGPFAQKNICFKPRKKKCKKKKN